MKVMFFAPNSSTWVAAFPEALIAESLRNSGHEINYVTCGMTYKDYCISMRSVGVPFNATALQKQAVCKSCNLNKEILRKEFRFDGPELGSYLTDDDRLRAQDIISKISREDFVNLEVNGYKVGRLALYELLLQHKKGDLLFNDEQWAQYLITLQNCLYTIFAGERIIDKEKPDRLITYNSLYSANATFCALAEKRDIPHFFLHSSLNPYKRLEGIYLGDRQPYYFLEKVKKSWGLYKDKPCPQEQISFITNTLIELFEGSSPFSYSSPKAKSTIDIRKKFGIQKEQKLILAALSSYDEVFGLDTPGLIPFEYENIFEDQVEWVSAIIDYIKKRPDLFLIIRVHPREFPNKRESIKSKHVEILEKTLENLPPNVRVNWPFDQLSIFDLAEETDVGLVCWSTAGKELSLLGIPVVTHSPDIIFYHSDLNFVARSKEDYFNQVEKALAEGWSLERMRRAYRWAVLDGLTSMIDISESYRFKEKIRKSFGERIFNKVMQKVYPGFRQRMDCFRRSKKLKDQDFISQILTDGITPTLQRPEILNKYSVSEAEETLYLKTEIRRLLKILKGKNGEQPSKLYRDLMGVL